MGQGRGRSEARTPGTDCAGDAASAPGPPLTYCPRPDLRSSSCPGPSQSSFPSAGPGLSGAPRAGLW